MMMMLQFTLGGVKPSVAAPAMQFGGEPRKKQFPLPNSKSGENLADSLLEAKKPVVRVADLRAILRGGGEKGRQQVEREDRLHEAMQDSLPDHNTKQQEAREHPNPPHRRHAQSAEKARPVVFPSLADSVITRNAKAFFEDYTTAQTADEHERQQIEAEYEMVEKGGPSAYYVPGQTPSPGWVPIETGRAPDQRSRSHKLREWLG